MRWEPSVGHVAAALIGLYFVPVFGLQALWALTSQVYGLDQPDMLAAVLFYRDAFALGPNAVAAVASLLAAVKLVMAGLFLAVTVDLLRGIQSRDPSDWATIDAALMFGALGIAAWALPAYLGGAGDIFRWHATHVLMITSALVVVTMERLLPVQAPVPAAQAAPRSWRQVVERDALYRGGLAVVRAVRPIPATAKASHR